MFLICSFSERVGFEVTKLTLVPSIYIWTSTVSVCVSAFILYARLCATALKICDLFESSLEPCKIGIITLIFQVWKLGLSNLKNGLNVHTAVTTAKIQTSVYLMH